MPGQSPPTVSGVVIISGSNNFDPVTSDFPAVVGSIYSFNIQAFDPPALVTNSYGANIFPTASGLLFTETMLTRFDPILFEPAGGFIPDPVNDFGITSTQTTTSGIVILEIFPGAGAGEPPFIPPIVLNARLFPIISTAEFIRTFPEENRRIYPVLPQFSLITPGD